MASRVRASDLGSIVELADAASGCQLCRLRRERTMVVPGTGPADADVLVVTEAPGYHEDRAGRHLTRAPGELFDSILGEAGLSRDQVFVTSVVRCRPPTGRTPFPDEVEACEGWLFREISLVQPRIVVTLGALALRLVTGRHEQLGDVHGTMLHAVVQGRDVAVWPLYHPAAALHVPVLVDQLREDARSLGLLVRGARSEASSAPPVPGSAPKATPAPAPVPAAPSVPGSEPGDDEAPQLAMEW